MGPRVIKDFFSRVFSKFSQKNLENFENTRENNP